MGKTKAGKSTLHAIVAGGGWQAIGVGKQRTTLCQQVYLNHDLPEYQLKNAI